MRAVLNAIGVLALSVLAATCGPGTPPLSGSITYSTGCTSTSASNCQVDNEFINGLPGNGTPPMVVACFIQYSDSGPSRIRFRIGRSMTSNVSDGFGVNVCGEISGSNEDLVNGKVDVFFSDHSSSQGNAAPGHCTVHINNFSSTGFDGSMHCTDITDDYTPSRTRYLSGTGMTTDPMSADFQFVSCSADFITCQ